MVRPSCRERTQSKVTMMITLTVNGHARRLDIEADTPLLWALRDTLGLTGTKYGCGQALCGACTVHIDGMAMRSCSVAIGDLDGSAITTIEGLSTDRSHPVQRAWIAGQVPQCGYCQPGQIMAAAALLSESETPSDEDIDSAMSNLCRCATYPRIRKAIKAAARLARAEA